MNERPVVEGRLHLGERLESQSSGHSPSGGTHIGCSQLPVEEKARSQDKMKNPAFPLGTLHVSHAGGVRQ